MEARGYSLAILGDEGVGKSSFCNRYVNKKFDIKQEPTIGGEYFQKVFFDNNQIIKVDIFASSGKKESEKIVKYLYKDARSIIIMFNLANKSTFDNINKYLENIRNNSVEDPIIFIVGNFKDEPGANNPQFENTIKNFVSNKFKYFKISCKTGEGINEVMKELTKEILVTEKYNTTIIDKDISDISSMDDGSKDMEKFAKILKQFYKEGKEKKATFIRCRNCDRLLIIKFRNAYNEVSFICNSCKTEKNVKLKEIDNYIKYLTDKIVCFECGKTKEEKIKLEYCGKCRHYVCPSCKKNIIRQLKSEGSEIHKLVPYFLMDISCFDHPRKILGYCKTCSKSFCHQCFEPHKTHENTFFDDFLEKLKDEHKDELKKEIANLNKFKTNFEDCINTIRKEVNNFINLKTNEIRLKEQLLNQLNTIQYNQSLIETIRNMKYMKDKTYDLNSSWDKKLTEIFEVIGQPIQIKTINISKNHVNNYIKPILIKLEEKNELARNEIQDEEQKSCNLFGETIKEITDFCSMNNDKYLGISFNTGILELYENIVEKKEPIHSYKIFEEGKGIKSICKSTRNMNNFFFCGKDKIKNIEFYNEYTIKKTIFEITCEDKIFNFCLEQNDFIITSDDSNKIILYDKQNNNIGDISECIDRSGSKDIFSLNEIMNNIIYITYNKIASSSNTTSQERSSYYLNEGEEANVDISMNRNSNKDLGIELGTKILELDGNNYEIKKEHVLGDNQELIGVIAEKYVLIRDEKYSSIILFNAKTFKNVQRFYYEEGEKPIFCSTLNRRYNLIDFVIVSEESDTIKLIQNIFDEEHRNVIPISGLKIESKNENDNYEIEKVGRFIHLPFKSLIKYSGDNNFMVINY